MVDEAEMPVRRWLYALRAWAFYAAVEFAARVAPFDAALSYRSEPRAAMFGRFPLRVIVDDLREALGG